MRPHTALIVTHDVYTVLERSYYAVVFVLFFVCLFVFFQHAHSFFLFSFQQIGQRGKRANEAQATAHAFGGFTFLVTLAITNENEGQQAKGRRVVKFFGLL